MRVVWVVLRGMLASLSGAVGGILWQVGWLVCAGVLSGGLVSGGLVVLLALVRQVWRRLLVLGLMLIEG